MSNNEKRFNDIAREVAPAKAKELLLEISGKISSGWIHTALEEVTPEYLPNMPGNGYNQYNKDGKMKPEWKAYHNKVMNISSKDVRPYIATLSDDTAKSVLLAVVKALTGVYDDPNVDGYGNAVPIPELTHMDINVVVKALEAQGKNKKGGARKSRKNHTRSRKTKTLRRFYSKNN